MRASIACAAALLAAAAAIAPRAVGGDATASPAASRLATPTLTAADGTRAPSQIDVDGLVHGAIVTETESCAGCHAEAAAQWSASAHAFASFNNPVYRASVDRFRNVVGRGPSRFCGGCHDVALLVDGAMDTGVADVNPADTRAFGGVTCRVCHGVEEARPDGNGSFRLASSPIPIPRDGDPASLQAHKERVALAPLRTAALCGACHRSFLSPETGNPAHLVGQDDLGAWRRSAYAGSLAARIDEPVAPAECRTCHMPLEAAPRGDASAKNGQIRSHRFAGGHTWLAAMRGDRDQLAAVRAMLAGAASLDIAAATGSDGTTTAPADGAPVRPGETLVLDVVVRNERVGHRFPGGVVDAQDTWIEVRVQDAKGRRVADSGTDHETAGASGRGDETAHVLRAVQADDHGAPVLSRATDLFRTPVFNHTIPPRDAEVVRYAFRVPAHLAPDALPLRVTARLRHRTRNAALARATCLEAKTPRGAAFARDAVEPWRGVLDACAPQPITEIATAETFLGGAVVGAAPTMPTWRRLYDHALGLSHATEENVDRARASLSGALDALPPDAATERAMVLQLGAEIAIREGRTAEALDDVAAAEALAPGHPALARTRADALSAVWRWQEAMEPMEAAARAAPLDDTLWSRLAVACGSAGDARAAREAAVRGLELVPRDADLLRVQALALERLGAPDADVNRARDAFTRWRAPDNAPAIKSACAQREPWCALERVPVHVHRMRMR